MRVWRAGERRLYFPPVLLGRISAVLGFEIPSRASPAKVFFFFISSELLLLTLGSGFEEERRAKDGLSIW